jgi:hypothetical protein
MFMKATLVLLTLGLGLIGATPSFAQTSTAGPSYPYPQGYEEVAPSGHVYGQLGSSEYGSGSRGHMSHAVGQMEEIR